MKYRIVTARFVLAFTVVFSFVVCGISESVMGDTPPVANTATDTKVVAKPESTSTKTQTLEEVEALIESRWSKLKSIKANLLTTSFANSEVVKVDTTARGTLVYMKQKGQKYFLKDIKTRGTRTPPGHIERKIDTHAKYICSGDTCYYVYLNDPKPDKVYKSEVESVETDFGGQGFIDYIHRNHVPSLRPSMVFEGEKVFVIQAVGKPDSSYVGQNIIAFVSEKTGMVHRIAIEMGGKERQLTTTYRDVEVNPEVDPKIFDYTPSVEATMVQKYMKK